MKSPSDFFDRRCGSSVLLTLADVFKIEQIADIGKIILNHRLAFDIQRDSLAVGDVHGNFGAEYAVLENGVNAFAHAAILLFRRHCFQLIELRPTESVAQFQQESCKMQSPPRGSGCNEIVGAETKTAAPGNFSS